MDACFFLNDSYIHSSNSERIIVSRGSCTLVPVDDVGVGAVIVVIGCAAAVVCLQLQLTRQEPKTKYSMHLNPLSHSAWARTFLIMQ